MMDISQLGGDHGILPMHFLPWQPYMVARQGTSRCRACPVGCAPRGTWSRSDRLPGTNVEPWCSYIHIYIYIYIYLCVYIYIYDVICSWCFRNPIPIISDHPIPYTWNVWPILMNIYESHMNKNNETWHETTNQYQPLKVFTRRKNMAWKNTKD